MITRRALLGVGGGALLSLGTLGRRTVAADYEPALNDDGLYEQPWFVQSFLDLSEDLELAHEGGRRFAVMWELKGCPYCRETHLVNFADPEIRGFVKDNFDILQLNLVGSREVTDFDGEQLEERELARKWRIRFTPTTCFFPETLGEVAGRSGAEVEVARMPGYFKPPHFLAMYRFVQEKAYESGDFRDYLQGAAAG